MSRRLARASRTLLSLHVLSRPRFYLVRDLAASRFAEQTVVILLALAARHGGAEAGRDDKLLARPVPRRFSVRGDNEK